MGLAISVCSVRLGVDFRIYDLFIVVHHSVRYDSLTLLELFRHCQSLRAFLPRKGTCCLLNLAWIGLRVAKYLIGRLADVFYDASVPTRLHAPEVTQASGVNLSKLIRCLFSNLCKLFTLWSSDLTWLSSIWLVIIKIIIFCHYSILNWYKSIHIVFVFTLRQRNDIILFKYATRFLFLTHHIFEAASLIELCFLLALDMTL